MDYKTLKKLLEALQSNDDEKVSIEKEVVISFIEEILLLRRRNTAKVRQRFITTSKKKLNTQIDLESKIKAYKYAIENEIKERNI